jgi:transmembrane sensor
MDSADKQYFIKILTKYRLGNATNEEIKFLEAYYDVFELSDDLITNENEGDYISLKDAIKDAVDQRIKDYQKQSIAPRIKFLWVKYAAAALILFFLSFGVYFLTNNSNINNNNVAVNAYKGIVPGGNKALLTLGNGTRILLDDALKGEIARQAGVIITKMADGQLVYKALSSQTSQYQLLQNSIATPKGGQYKVILPDGTNVWLNASSSITYPTIFTGNERMVTLTGEAYFEVVKNKQMPFRVKSAMQTIEVLGTHFNINAYDDEAVVGTTLLEGSVKVTSPSSTATIAPGEQAVINRGSNGTIIKRQVDIDKEVAWKNGIFSFNGEDIRSVMRQVSRWYNIDVVYDKDIPHEKYFGEISRSSSLGDVFKILELNNVRFNIEGKTVTVSNKK